MTSRVIDADGHICETRELWQEYVPKAFRDRTIRMESTADGRDQLWVNGAPTFSNAARACVPAGMADPEHPPCWDDIHKASYDGAARLEVMDEEGIEHCLMFPSLYLRHGDIIDPAVAAATCSAYNEWIADMCKAGRGRLDAVGLVPLQDVKLATAEIAHIARLGLKGVAFRPERYNGMALFDEQLAPFWSAICDADLFAGVHGSFGVQMPSFANSRYDNNFFIHMVCHPFEQMAASMDLICGGVLQRHPKLRVAFLESGLGWLPYWLGRMDEHYEVMGHDVPWLQRKPSEIFAEQCFISVEADEAARLPELAALGVDGCVFWGSDYPHFDCTYPGAVAELESHLEPLDAALAEKIRRKNAMRFMGLS
jgi:uncharacterized protein